MPNRVNQKYCALFDACAAKAADIYNENVVILPLFSFPLGSFAPLNFLHTLFICVLKRELVYKADITFSQFQDSWIHDAGISLSFPLARPLLSMSVYVAVTVAKY